MMAPAIARTTQLLLSALIFLSAEALALSMDVGMLTQVQGAVTLAGEKESGKAAPAFTKVRAGDKLTLSQGARLQLVYFDGGRQETWQGSGQLEVGTSESKSATLKPEVKQLPDILVKQLVKSPSPDVKNRAGMIMMRAIATPQDIKAFEDNYAAMRKEMAPTDFTPELYLLSGLFEHKEYQRIKEVLADLNAKHPDNSDVKAMAEHYGRVTDIALSKKK